MKTPIYLDNSATTPVDPVVLDAMLPFLRGEFGNPASGTHTSAARPAAPSNRRAPTSRS
jgi:cysteine sulfinate desulfinase/cysteine desulfurase-like protein